MRMKPTQKIGIVTLTKDSPTLWRLRYLDPQTGTDIRRRISGLTEKEVLAIASHVSQEALSTKGYLPGKQAIAPGIEEGIVDALNLSRMRPHVRKMAASRAMCFAKWLAKKYPAVKMWDGLRPFMVQGYMRGLEEQGLAFDTVRLRLAPIKQAWRYMAENYPDTVKPLPRFRQVQPARHEIEYLEAKEVDSLLTWLKVNNPIIHALGCLQALCGLRMLEASSLRIQDIDFGAATVTVTETPSHKPKTRDSFRTIPIIPEVIEALKDAIAKQSVIPTSGEIFTNKRAGTWKFSDLSHAWTIAKRAAATALENPRLATIPARKLRAAFATMAGRLGVSDRLLKAYMGHTSGDILGEHYRAISIDDLRAVSGVMNTWKTLLSWQKSGNSEKGESVSA